MGKISNDNLMTKILCSVILLLSLCGIWHNPDFSLKLCSPLILRRLYQFISFLLDNSFSVSFNQISSSSLAFRQNLLQFLSYIFFLSFPFSFPLPFLSLSIRPWQVVCHSSASYFSQQSLTQRNLKEYTHTHTHIHDMDQETRLYIIYITYNLRKVTSTL